MAGILQIGYLGGGYALQGRIPGIPTHTRLLGVGSHPTSEGTAGASRKGTRTVLMDWTQRRGFEV